MSSSSVIRPSIDEVNFAHMAVGGFTTWMEDRPLDLLHVLTARHNSEEATMELLISKPQTQRLPTFPAAAPTETPPMSRLLARTLDELDYGILLLDATGTVLHSNQRARRMLQQTPVLQLLGPQLRACDSHDVAPLYEALHAAAERGLRKLLRLGGRGDSSTRLVAALVPVEPGVAALMLGRDHVCEELSVECFARTHGLTAAETRVLAALGLGRRPATIAEAQGVKLSTVRTQIGSIREKTGAESITALIRMVAALPPMLRVLRC
jgi:DNA-binding CsgD family transcriptional regulator/PAS domain-containing protein